MPTIDDQSGRPIADEAGDALVAEVPAPITVDDESGATIEDELGNPIEAEGTGWRSVVDPFAGTLIAGREGTGSRLADESGGRLADESGAAIGTEDFAADVPGFDPWAGELIPA